MNMFNLMFLTSYMLWSILCYFLYYNASVQITMIKFHNE